MPTFAAIHTDNPLSQNHNEAAYNGYKRMPVEFSIGAEFINIFWPEVLEDSSQVMTHISIGTTEKEGGDLFLIMPVLPYIPLVKMLPGKVPHVIITWPENLGAAARVMHQLVLAGKMRPEDMTPPLFDQVNKELAAVGIPILKATRQAAATWHGKMSQMPSLKELAVEGHG